MDLYLPLSRLLCREDVEQFRRQPGYSWKEELVFRYRRYLVFRVVVQALRSEFDKTTRELKAVLAGNREDRPELAKILIRESVLFACGIRMLQFRAILYRFGLTTLSNRQLEGVFAPFSVAGALTGLSC